MKKAVYTKKPVLDKYKINTLRETFYKLTEAYEEKTGECLSPLFWFIEEMEDEEFLKHCGLIKEWF